MSSDTNYYFAIIRPYRKDFITNPNKEDIEIMEKHFAYLKSLLENGSLYFAGPTLIESDPYGVIIFETATEVDARRLLENDPSVKAGIQKIADLRPIRLSLLRNG